MKGIDYTARFETVGDLYYRHAGRLRPGMSNATPALPLNPLVLGNKVDALFKDELDKALKTEAGQQFTAALKSIAAKVDSELNGRILTAVRQSLGVK